ncbi:hypothetical protein AB0G67_42855 [Streptomyces sp. NPDC021056]|uniref:hypothetical protein n=1 Tax=Streptomyces sp. NPDC021056 TaxID=3155012 RepID=UPI0033C6B41A
MGTLVGLPALVTTVIVIVPRVIRAWGAKLTAEGERESAAADGRAAVIRAEREGEAAVLRAKAELRRAEAEFLRAEKGLAPLPPAPQPGETAALSPSSSNGNTPQEEQPQT